MNTALRRWLTDGLANQMLLIDCPWCGVRDESEYSYGGEAGLTRPQDPAALSDAAWADYLFMRKNPRGRHQELWNHALGCRRWFVVIRDTVSYRIEATATIDAFASDSHDHAG